jgi:hypothetical protein
MEAGLGLLSKLYYRNHLRSKIWCGKISLWLAFDLFCLEAGWKIWTKRTLNKNDCNNFSHISLLSIILKDHSSKCDILTGSQDNQHIAFQSMSLAHKIRTNSSFLINLWIIKSHGIKHYMANAFFIGFRAKSSVFIILKSSTNQAAWAPSTFQ